MGSTTIAARLAAYLAERAAQPFDWPHNNCCHLAAQWCALVSGRNPMAGLPATPDARSALRLVRRLGGNLRGAWTRQLGREAIPASLARTGDLVLVRTAGMAGTGHAVGICNGRQVLAMDDQGRVVPVPMDAAECAWRLEVAA